jgi:hypothetical protein
MGDENGNAYYARLRFAETKERAFHFVSRGILRHVSPIYLHAGIFINGSDEVESQPNPELGTIVVVVKFVEIVDCRRLGTRDTPVWPLERDVLEDFREPVNERYKEIISERVSLGDPSPYPILMGELSHENIFFYPSGNPLSCHLLLQNKKVVESSEEILQF